MTHCADASIAAAESIIGTAANETLHWVGIEVRGPWRPKAIMDNRLPKAVQAWLVHTKAQPGTRPLFIKRRGKREGITVFYVNIVLERVHRFSLQSYEQLLTLPWPKLRSGESRAGLCEERPIWVCTHSARDHCCGLHGPSVARSLEASSPGQVWQCTHLGGHRFAATLVAMPQGVHFGRVRASECDQLARELQAGRVYDLQRFRGMVRYPNAVQAAAAHVRHAEQLTEIDAVSVRSYDQHNDGWSVCLESASRRYDLQVHRSVGTAQTPSSCGATPTPTSVWTITPTG